MNARVLLSLAVTGGLLAWALSRIAESALSFDALQPGWLALGVLSTAPPFAAVAWRWSLTARRLGLELPFTRALPEVYAAALLNGLLPSGMAGDALRVVRHGAELADGGPAPQQRGSVISPARGSARSDVSTPARGGARSEVSTLARGGARSDISTLARGGARFDISTLARKGARFDVRALWAVVLERASGQLVLWTVLLFGLAWWPIGRVRADALALGLLALALAAYASTRIGARWRALLRKAHVALVADGAWRGQLLASALVIAGCAATFACSARALGAPVSGRTLLQVVPPLLAITSLPLSIGGFGLRELANGALYAAAGLDADTGIAVATVYGVSGLIGSLPGALCLGRSNRAAQSAK